MERFVSRNIFQRILAIICLVFLWILFFRLIIPSLIESAYRGESLPILNSFLSGQAKHPVAHYLSFWDRIAWRVLIALILVGLPISIISPTAIMKRWDTYWFRPAPVVDLAIFRIVVVLYQLLHWLPMGVYKYFLNLTAIPQFLYDPLPILYLLIWPFGLSYRPSFEILLVVYWITIASGLLALVGFKTNFSLIIFVLGNLFNHALSNSFGDFHHPDALMIIILIILAMTPAGRALSVDDLRYRLHLNIQRKKFVVFSLLQEKSDFARWPLLLAQWMFAFIYLSATLNKLDKAGLSWLNGFTLQYYMLQDGLRWGQ
jgi:uncharacterized membrane protein YphA (DoxX/SURF4 family)